MKAEDLEKQLKEFYTTNKESKGSGFGKRLIELYARIQIEKRTNEIIDIITDYESPMPNEFIMNRIKELNGNLD